MKLTSSHTSSPLCASCVQHNAASLYTPHPRMGCAVVQPSSACYHAYDTTPPVTPFPTSSPICGSSCMRHNVVVSLSNSFQDALHNPLSACHHACDMTPPVTPFPYSCPLCMLSCVRHDAAGISPPHSGMCHACDMTLPIYIL